LTDNNGKVAEETGPFWRWGRTKGDGLTVHLDGPVKIRRVSSRSESILNAISKVAEKMRLLGMLGMTKSKCLAVQPDGLVNILRISMVFESPMNTVCKIGERAGPI
jgi:hypothetical protein